MRVGLMGGSFNPAHEGHLHIARLALAVLELNCVWWLVSPQNPLKSAKDMAPYVQRLKTARQMARDPRIHVSDIEARRSICYTVDTLKFFRQRYAGTNFIWLMGADSFAELSRWHRPDDIMYSLPIAVFARGGVENMQALSGPIAQRYARFRLAEEDASALARQKPPAWLFFSGPRHPLSATSLRARRI
jgi:nicotinate-nucleotide adenylyltransferase